MSTAPLDIRVIYSAKPGRPQPRRSRRAGIAKPRTARSPWKSWAALGLMNIVVAGGVYYATWWRVDPFLYMTTVWNAPLPGVNVEAAAAMLGLGAEPPKHEPIDNTNRVVTNPEPGSTRNAALFGGAVYGWLTLSTLAYILLSLSGGVSLAKAGAGRWRRVWMILLLGSVAFAAFAVFDELSRFGKQFPPNHLRWAMSGLIALGALVGLAFNHWPRGLARIAALALILSAVGSVVGLILLQKYDAVEAKYAGIPFLALVFLVHSFYGWLLFPVSRRLGRS